MNDVNAHPDGELTRLIEQQRHDTVDWQRNNNLSPQGESPVVGEVHVSDINEEISELGAQVTLSSPGQRMGGKVVAATDEELWVNWEDGQQTIEKKANYTLVVATEEPTRNLPWGPEGSNPGKDVRCPKCTNIINEWELAAGKCPHCADGQIRATGGMEATAPNTPFQGPPPVGGMQSNAVCPDCGKNPCQCDDAGAPAGGLESNPSTGTTPFTGPRIQY